MYECAGEHPIGIKFHKVHHFIAIFQMQIYTRLLRMLRGCLLHQFVELLLTFNIYHFIGCSITRVWNDQPTHCANDHVVQTVINFGHKQQTCHTHFANCHRINEEL